MKQKNVIGWGLVLVVCAFLAGMLVSVKTDLVGDIQASWSKSEGESKNSPAGEAVSNPFVDIAKQDSPAVVNINTTRIIKSGGKQQFRDFRGRNPFEDFFGEDFFDRYFKGMPEGETKQRSLGSGFIIDHEGHVLTNNHVVEKADDINVTLASGEEYRAKVIGRDRSTDIALIKIDDEDDLPVAKLGDSDLLEVGEWVMAIGNPFGLKHTVTVGVVSAKGRTIGAGPYDDFIQTDASINPGNSGGPLINIKGEVVGINTAIIASGQGIGFAIPINKAKEIVDQLKETGHVTRGWMGVQIQPLTEELAESFGLEEAVGALVAGVIEGDPADKAGILRGDIIIEFDGKKIESDRDLVNIVGSTPVDKEVKIKLIREGKEVVVDLKVSLRAEPGEEMIARETGEEKLGITVQDITKELADSMGLESTDGVLVSDVNVGGAADDGGVRRGDVILELDRQPVTDTEKFQEIVSGLEEGQVVLVLVHRNNATTFLTMKLE
jgi:serine protease Do